MKVVVEDEADFKKWLSGNKTLGVAVKEAKEGAAAPAEPASGEAVPAKPADSAATKVDSTAVAQVLKK